MTLGSALLVQEFISDLACHPDDQHYGANDVIKERFDVVVEGPRRARECRTAWLVTVCCMAVESSTV